MKKFLAFLLLVAFLIGTHLSTNAKEHPNIIFILADDLGWRDVGYMGNTIIETPNIDKLASSGMVFTQGYSSAPTCTPTRASIMTGKYPGDLKMFAVIPSLKPNPEWDYGVPRGNNYNFFNTGDRYDYAVTSGSYLPLEEKTVAEYLKEKGYKTCYLGKWHLGHQPYHPIYQGFDKQIGTANYGSPPTYFFPYETMRNEQKRVIEDLNKEGKPGEYLTDRLTDEAIQFIEENKKNPFFISLNFYNPHSPYYAKDELKKYYQEKKGLNVRDAVYAAMIHTLDQNVGRLVSAIENAGIRKETLIIFTSDNGGVGGISYLNPLRGSKGNLYEGGIRVPVIFSFKGVIEPGIKEKFPLSSIDYLPTILAFAGVNYDNRDMRGLNLLPILKGENPIENRQLFWHFPQLEKDMVVREGDYKLIMNSRSGRKELYNLVSDPSESDNLKDKYPEKLERLENLIKSFLLSEN
ncbi:MAG: sulfatase [Bacteroidales bacterium]